VPSGGVPSARKFREKAAGVEGHAVRGLHAGSCLTDRMATPHQRMGEARWHSATPDGQDRGERARPGPTAPHMLGKTHHHDAQA